MNDFYINACGGIPTPNVIALAVMRSGLQWEMNAAQVFGLEMLALERSTRFDFEVSTEAVLKDRKELQPESNVTLMGIPVVVKNEYPMSLIRLMYNDEEVTRIEALAVPAGFSRFSDEEMERERRKMEAIGFRRTTQETQ